MVAFGLTNVIFKVWAPLLHSSSTNWLFRKVAAAGTDGERRVARIMALGSVAETMGQRLISMMLGQYGAVLVVLSGRRQDKTTRPLTDSAVVKCGRRLFLICNSTERLDTGKSQ